MTKTGETIALLHRHATLARTIYNTGAILEEAITPALGLRKLVWQPRHASPLSNQVQCSARILSVRDESTNTRTKQWRIVCNSSSIFINKL